MGTDEAEQKKTKIPKRRLTDSSGDGDPRRTLDRTSRTSRRRKRRRTEAVKASETSTQMGHTPLPDTDLCVGRRKLTNGPS